MSPAFVAALDDPYELGLHHHTSGYASSCTWGVRVWLGYKLG